MIRTRLLLSLLLVFSEVGWAAAVGKVTELQGEALVLRGEKVSALKPTDQLHEGDSIVTKRGARLQAALEGEGRLWLGEHTKLRIKRYSKGREDTAMELYRGGARISVPKTQGKFSVEAQNALITAKGTDFELSIEGLTTRVITYEGAVTVLNNDPHVGGKIILRRGQAAHVRQGTRPDYVNLVSGTATVPVVTTKGSTEFGSGSRQDLWSSGRQDLDPTTALPAPGTIIMPPNPNPP